MLKTRMITFYSETRRKKILKSEMDMNILRETKALGVKNKYIC
jgi:hypothetical protein